MSDTHRPQPRDRGIAPAGVTDPLLWRLAVDVVEAHQPDDAGRCDSLLCGHQEWPCETAHRARRALELSGVAEQEAPLPRQDQRRDQAVETRQLRRIRTAAEAA